MGGKYKDRRKSHLKNLNISYSDKIETLKKYNDSNLDRFFLQCCFKQYKDLYQRRKNPYWKETFDNLLNATYDMEEINKCKSIPELEKVSRAPYELYKLCKENALVKEDKELVYNVHKQYLKKFLEICFYSHEEFFKYYIAFVDFITDEEEKLKLVKLLSRNYLDIYNPKYTPKYVLNTLKGLNLSVYEEIEARVLMNKLSTEGGKFAV